MFNKEFLQEFLRENNITTAKELQVAIKDIFLATLHEMLEAELDEHLRYSRYDYKNRKTKNSRNKTMTKKVLSEFGEINVAVPRDHNDEFEPRALRKRENDISGI